MQNHRNTINRLFFATLGLLMSGQLLAQGTPLPIELLPLGKDIGIRSGQTVTPAFEGWYENEDGSISYSFGYYNRNTQEVMEIPIGPANRIIGAPDGDPNQGQPTTFEVHRHWGVFTIDVPADYEGEIVWHLENQGKTHHIPANRNPDFVIDAIVGDANGNFPPQIRFSEDATWGHGPSGVTTGPLQARVGRPLIVEAWIQDDGTPDPLMAIFLGGGNGRVPPVNLQWFKHQGQGKVEFSEVSAGIPSEGGKAETEVTFNTPGSYMLRARITEPSGPERAGHSQCCWTNGFVKVQVSE